ncbi:C1q and tumor necrosis factor-related protein-like protein 2 [Daphnia sinensis]|uniref:C1q and tumor necrosis factor-related protein-like protein 2 n=1 Tax=Daphnia sinensis TaxID=1820382 RepID=A0AAD5KQ50_9CRUS|nr:C1q and tumor necrosis factor-related protein-like protein 2 [Daphnia sinensis]
MCSGVNSHEIAKRKQDQRKYENTETAMANEIDNHQASKQTKNSSIALSFPAPQDNPVPYFQQVLMTVALVSSLTPVSPNKFLLSQDNPYDLTYYPRPAYGPGYVPFHIPPGSNAKSTLSDDFVQTRALGVIDLFLVTKLTTRVNKLEDALNYLNANSQATAGELRAIKSDLSKLEKTVDATKDKLATFKSDLDAVKRTVDATKNTVATIKRDVGTIRRDLDATKATVATLQTDLSSVKESVDETKTTVANLETDLSAVKETMQATVDQVSNIESDQSILKATVAGLSEPTSIGRMPTSCLDLQELGNVKSGLYNIKSSTKVGAVYCDFTKDPNDADFQQTIGSLNVQTAPVYFYVLRTTDLANSQATIPFDIENLNVGGAMDIATGTFTAPVDGTYFFSFSGTVTTPSVQLGAEVSGTFEVALQLNGNLVKKTVVRGSSVPHTLSHAVHLDATLNLKKGDQISLSSFDSDNTSLLEGGSSNSFTGMLLAEENFPTK